MKRTGFKRLTFEEAVAKNREARDRYIEKKKAEGFVTKVKSKPKKKLKPERVKNLKTKLWTIFSRYIRKRNANTMTGFVMTSDGKYQHWKTTHCGHLYTNSERSRSLGGNELWYYENNFAPQSASGNMFNSDDSAKKYMLWATKKYGVEEMDKMFRMKQTPRKFTEEELQEKYKYYKAKFDIL